MFRKPAHGLLISIPWPAKMNAFCPRKRQRISSGLGTLIKVSWICWINECFFSQGRPEMLVILTSQLLSLNIPSQGSVFWKSNTFLFFQLFFRAWHSCPTSRYSKLKVFKLRFLYGVLSYRQLEAFRVLIISYASICGGSLPIDMV